MNTKKQLKKKVKSKFEITCRQLSINFCNDEENITTFRINDLECSSNDIQYVHYLLNQTFKNKSNENVHFNALKLIERIKNTEKGPLRAFKSGPYILAPKYFTEGLIISESPLHIKSPLKNIDIFFCKEKYLDIMKRKILFYGTDIKFIHKNILSAKNNIEFTHISSKEITIDKSCIYYYLVKTPTLIIRKISGSSIIYQEEHILPPPSEVNYFQQQQEDRYVVYLPQELELPSLSRMQISSSTIMEEKVGNTAEEEKQYVVPLQLSSLLIDDENQKINEEQQYIFDSLQSPSSLAAEEEEQRDHYVVFFPQELIMQQQDPMDLIDQSQQEQQQQQQQDPMDLIDQSQQEQQQQDLMDLINQSQQEQQDPLLMDLIDQSLFQEQESQESMEMYNKLLIDLYKSYYCDNL